MSLNDIRIGPKLIASFLAVACIVVGVAAVGYRNTKALNRELDLMYNSRFAPVTMWLSIDSTMMEIRGDIYKAIWIPDAREKMLNNVRSRMNGVNESVEKYRSGAIDVQEKDGITRFDEAWKEYQSVVSEDLAYLSENNIKAVVDSMRDEGKTTVVRKRASAVVKEMIKMNEEGAKTDNSDGDALFAASSRILFAAAFIGVLVAVLLGIVITLSITRPLSLGVDMMKELARGHLGRRLKLERKDEIGTLTAEMDAFADTLQKDMVGALTRISEGDVHMDIELKDPQDEIAPALKRLVETLRSLVTEANSLSAAAVAGKLNVRGDAARFKGSYRDIVQGINDTLDAVITPLKKAAVCIDRISKGDIPERITASYNGEFNELKNSLNTCIDAIKALIAEADALTKEIKDGQLDARANAAGHQGDYRKVIEGFNGSVDVLAGLVTKTTEHLRKLSRGEVPEIVTREYKGKVQELRDDFNTLFRTIHGLVADVNMLTGAAADGKLSVRADAAKHQGDFRKIIEGVNNTMDAVVRPIQEASVVLDRMANNDLSGGMTGDYKGDLALIKHNINKVLDTLNASLGKVAEAVSQVASASQQLSSTAEEMSAGAEEQTNQTSQVATSMEEMSATVTQVAKNSNIAVNNAQEAGKTAAKGGEVVEQTVNGMKRIAGSVRELQQVIDELAKNSEKIGDIVSVIDDVADQTNLLALNAAIEAARAGEQGRGFAVVADEVRKLAERTTTSTKEIAAMVKTIQDDTSKASSSMEHSAGEVESGMEHAASAGTSLKEIVAGAQQVQEMIKQIATAAEQQSAAAEEISSNIESIASVSKQNAQGAQQTSSAAQELSGLTDELQSLVGHFKLKEGMVAAQARQAHVKKAAGGMRATVQ